MGRPVASEQTAEGRWVVGGLVALGLLVVAYFALGMPGMDHGSPGEPSMPGMGHDMPAMEHSAGRGSSMAGVDVALPVGEFAIRMASADAFVVNVHVPADSEIPATDASIPFDQITDDGALPADTSTPILLYCQTGRMSAQAAQTLMAQGFANVAYLDGGMDAWQASGRPLQ